MENYYAQYGRRNPKPPGPPRFVWGVPYNSVLRRLLLGSLIVRSALGIHPDGELSPCRNLCQRCLCCPLRQSILAAFGCGLEFTV